MMAGNPNWWSIINGNGSGNGIHPQPAPQFFHGNPNLSSIISPNSSHQDHFPVRSWNQLLLGGSGGEERFQFQQQKKVVENWEDNHVLLNLMNININNNNNNNNNMNINNDDDVDIKQQIFHPQFNYPTNEIFHHHHHQQQQQHPVNSSPNSTTTSLTNTFLNFSGTKTAPAAPPPPLRKRNHNRQDPLSHEGSEGVQPKKARVQQSSSAQPALKVRKEKLGDRITALHQLVSPFGKTDTASVLTEAISYIRFLHAQIQALNSPYMRNNNTSSSSSGNSSIIHPQHFDSEGAGVQDLRSRGLCLVPISCTQNYVTGNHHPDGGDYWHGGASAF